MTSTNGVVKLRVAILGSGNIATDLLIKAKRSATLEVVALVGIDPESEGLRRARSAGVFATHEGVPWILMHADAIDLVIDATSASAHVEHTPKLTQAGLQ